MKKICFSMLSFQGGGAERVVVYLANGLAEMGYDVDIVTLLKPDGPYRSKVSEKVNIVDLGRGKKYKSLLPFARYMKSVRPDVLFSSLYNTMLILLCRVMGCEAKVVSVIHSNYSLDKRTHTLKGKLDLWKDRRLYSLADRVVGVSEGVTADMIGLGLTDEAKGLSICNPIVPDDFGAKASEAVEALWQDDGIPVVLAVGALKKAKDYATLLRAFARLLDTRPSRLVVLGEGVLRKELERLTEELGIGKFVSMPGFADNPFAYMARADLFVLSSVREGLPTVVVEALAAGTTVVSTDCPSGPAEILEDGKFGYLAPVGDVERLAEVMSYALDHPMPKDMLRERAGDFSVEKAVGMYAQLIEELVS